MKGRFSIPFLTLWAFALLGAPPACARFPQVQDMQGMEPEAGGEHLRVETAHGPLHLWRPARYDSRTAGMVVYIHGYFTSVDQTWTDDRLAEQFQDSRRNALFVAIRAPQSNDEDVAWKSLDELLTTVADLIPFPLPKGPLVVIGHSGAFRTILVWLDDPRLRYVILLDGLYGGEAEFHDWLRPHPKVKPHRMVLVADDTWRQCSQFSRHVYGTARRRRIPVRSTNFTRREAGARLLYLRSQYGHNQIVNNGKVIPLLLEISPLRAVVIPRPHPTRKPVHGKSASRPG